MLPALWLSILACGYQFSGGGNFPAGIRSISINMFENPTAETGVENVFTNDLIYELTRAKKVILTTKDHADAILTGVIASLQTHTITHRGQSTSLERRITVSIDLMINDAGGRLIWSAKNVSAYEEYNVSSDKQVTERNRQNAISELSKRLAENIYNRLTDDF
ncbi:MAG: hypothetical protein KKH68_09125 [Proteobacteria bacterium]|nr:hypothetical protein [Pseudomonadota bacterium]